MTRRFFMAPAFPRPRPIAGHGTGPEPATAIAKGRRGATAPGVAGATGRLTGRVLDSQEKDPHVNLATDHAIVEACPEHGYPFTIRFWSTVPCVVLGKNQAVEDEVNLSSCRELRIQLSRRMSGGGTVYQDPGNLNTSIITRSDLIPPPRDVSSVNLLFTGIMKHALESLGFSGLRIVGTTNLYQGNHKVSGGAGWHHGRRVLHHATLLHGADLDAMARVLIASPGMPRTRSGSEFAPTRNLVGLDVARFKEAMVNACQVFFPVDLLSAPLTPWEKDKRDELFNQRYSLEAWVFRK